MVSARLRSSSCAPCCATSRTRRTRSFRPSSRRWRPFQSFVIMSSYSTHILRAVVVQALWMTSRCVAGRRDVSAGRARLVDQRPAPAERADAVQCVRQPRRQQEVLQLQGGQCLCAFQAAHSGWWSVQFSGHPLNRAGGLCSAHRTVPIYTCILCCR